MSQQPPQAPHDHDEQVIDVQPKPPMTAWQRLWARVQPHWDHASDVFSNWMEKLSPSMSPQLAQQNGLHDLESPLRARWVLRVIILGLLLLIVWAAVGKIDQVTRAQAVLIAADRTQLVQSPDGGVLTELHVKEGQPSTAASSQRLPWPLPVPPSLAIT